MSKSPLARDYFKARAINPRIAHEAGVTLDGNKLVFPNGRYRYLTGDAPKVIQPKGVPLAGWWVRKLDPASELRTAVVTEGESDGLATLTALLSSPEVVGLRDLPVLAIPGVGYPAARLVADLNGFRAALLPFDSDVAGWRLTGTVSAALIAADIRPIPIHLPEGKDLAAWLAGMPEERRGDALANLLIDSEADAPTLEALKARQRAMELRAEADRLEEAAA